MIIFFSAQERLAASASSNAFTPSSMVIGTGPLSPHRAEELRHLGRVGRTVTLEKERLRDIGRTPPCSYRGYLGRSHVASLKHSLASKHFETLVVSIDRPPAGVYLAEFASTGPNRDGGGVNVTRPPRSQDRSDNSRWHRPSPDPRRE